MSSIGVDGGQCFGCGRAHALGLQLSFSVEGLAATCETVVSANFQGWRDIVHGGIVMLLLDEAMAHATRSLGWIGVTAECRVRFRRPVPVEAPLSLYGNVVWHRRRVAGVVAEVRDAEHNILATANGIFVRSRDESRRGVT